jgi:hypothetical protein
VGHWLIKIEETRECDVMLRFPSPEGFADLHLRWGDTYREHSVAPGERTRTFESVWS